MLTLQQTDRELKILWSLSSHQSEDLAGFVQIREIKQEVFIEKCLFYLLGEKEIPMDVWRALLSSLKVLLDRNIKLVFICTSKKIEAMLHAFGFYLFGDLLLDPSADVSLH